MSTPSIGLARPYYELSSWPWSCSRRARSRREAPTPEGWTLSAGAPAPGQVRSAFEVADLGLAGGAAMA